MNVPRLGFLFPGRSAEDDYPRMGSMIAPPVDVRLVHTTVGEDAHREDALRDTGNAVRLMEGAVVLREMGVDVTVWACTSASFVFGLEGAKAQADMLERFMGVPASSTSLAFAAALRALAVDAVAIAATYPDDITRLFRDFLSDAGVITVHSGSLGIITGVEVGGLKEESVAELVKRNNHPDAQAIVVPDTALHTAGLVDELEDTVGKPVLTANQVSMWEALRLTGHPGGARAGLGSLLRRPG